MAGLTTALDHVIESACAGTLLREHADLGGSFVVDDTPEPRETFYGMWESIMRLVSSTEALTTAVRVGQSLRSLGQKRARTSHSRRLLTASKR